MKRIKPTGFSQHHNQWHYMGDMNVECGGWWWKESGYDDHVYVVEIVPYTDKGGPHNEFLITYDTSIYMPAELTTRLEAERAKNKETTTRFDLVNDAYAHQGIESGSLHVIRVGRDEDRPSRPSNSPDVILRSNVNLRRYIEREYLN